MSKAESEARTRAERHAAVSEHSKAFHSVAQRGRLSRFDRSP